MGLSNYIPSSRIAQSGVCTSTTRPATPYEGQMIYETDTDKVLVWNGSAWYANWNAPWGVVGYASKTTDTSFSTTAVDISGLSITWTAVSGRMYKTSFYGIASLNTANAYIDASISDNSNNLIQLVRATTPASSSRFSLIAFVYETGLSGSKTRKMRVSCTSGAGNIDGAVGYPHQFIVEDIGPA